MANKKIYVYAISKNESKFVKRWVKSMQEADGIYVLDTGSTDDTVKLLKELGVHVKTKKIIPWRFDVARNESLKMVPDDADICVCTDLDEIFEAGWRVKLENAWQDDTTRLSYLYNWGHDENKRPNVTFLLDKIHAKQNYMWKHPVHEVLTYLGETEKRVIAKEIVLNHFPDVTKSRGSYLPLLELSVKEDPTDDRNMHYLGREYMYYGRWNECIDTLINHLKLPKATWKDERSASMRFIARSYKALKRFDEAKMWLEKARKETPYLRDPLVESAILAYDLKEWDDVIKFGLQALTIKDKALTYINETFSWDYTIYDLLAIAYFYKGDYDQSLQYENLALAMAPTNERLKSNKQIIEAKVNKPQ